MPEQSVRIGFAGSRHLFADAADETRQQELTAALQIYLQRILEPTDSARSSHGPKPIAANLGLSAGCRLEAVSQVAIGADVLFTRACRALGIPQRIFLPSPAAEYLAAKGTDGTRDFSASEANASAALLASEHVIECRVVGDSNDRETRFEQTNQAIAAASDVILCVRDRESLARPGGTAHLLALATAKNMPTLELGIEAKNGRLDVTERWFNSN